MPIENQRLKQAREELKLTQSAMGEALEMTSTADIERGKMRIPGRAVMLLLQKYQINPLWLYGESEKKILNTQQAHTLPHAITVEADGQENILLVPAKAAAGYGENIGDAEYVSSLPTFGIPLPEYRHASFRGFQITGDSMTPLVYPDDWVLTRAVNSMDEVKDGNIYVIIEQNSIRLKQIKKSKDKLTLISLNPDYAPTTVATSEILEIWEYFACISSGTDRLASMPTLEDIYTELQDIKKKIN